MRGRLRELLSPLLRTGVLQGERQGAGGLVAAAQQPRELYDQVEEAGADVGAVQDVAFEAQADGGGRGQGAGDDGAGVDAAGPVGGQASGLAAEEALDGLG
ncbi:hypothetical protein ACGFY8_36925 [Streptomyces sp. NPDC048232]|uniref:hypothetical protein n=1 Tax=Streptomyces sp. NPDC048232 TaxID=3365520 RepID=UPI00371F5C39